MDLEHLLESEGATSFGFADCEEDAVASAMAMRPDVITCDFQLAHGTGPNAVSIIHKRLGMIPVIFVTATPRDCGPCEPPHVVLSKPINAGALIEAFHNAHHSDAF